MIGELVIEDCIEFKREMENEDEKCEFLMREYGGEELWRFLWLLLMLLGFCLSGFLICGGGGSFN